MTLLLTAVATYATAAETIPVGQWFGATSVDSLPEIVRLDMQEGQLFLRYENDRKCQVHAKYLNFDGGFFKYQIGDSDCAHMADPMSDIWIRPHGDKLEYRFARKTDNTTTEVGYLYKK